MILGYVASLIMGVTLGLMGGGGSILTVPILVYLFSFSPTDATSFSLFVVGTTALVGGLSYVRSGHVNFKSGLAFAIPSIAGVYMSRVWIVRQLPSDLGGGVSKDLLIMVAFAALMVWASLGMIRKRAINAKSEASQGKLAGQGLLVGLTVGFVGAGGGFLIVPALVLMAGMPMRVAVGTSLMIIAAQSLIGFAGDAWIRSDVPWRLLMAVTVMAVLGILLGNRFSHSVSEAKLKAVFGYFVLVMGSLILIQQIGAII